MKHIQRKAFSLMTMCASFLFLVPLYMVLINSLKPRREAALFSIKLPTQWQWDNYRQVLESAHILQAFVNGLIISIGSGVLIILVSSLCAYVIARSRQKWAQTQYYLFLSGLVIPVAFIPTYLVLNALNLLNTYAGLILVAATYGLPMSIFLYAGFVKTIPRELDEAAVIEGCPPLQFFFQIVFPLIKPVTMTLVIFNFVGSWNDIQIPLYFSSSDKWALPLTVYNFYGAHSSAWNLIFADIIITIFPLLILYVFAQKYITEGMTAGAVKG